ncbi:beta-1,3-galactosyltransferase brn-like [Argopecten irradians]|uniref:beta-1,3-galactosyltransferase brn-like n=1 Tax=Argopecten irradians TaxID=31199 RepID=UPI003718368F
MMRRSNCFPSVPCAFKCFFILIALYVFFRKVQKVTWHDTPRVEVRETTPQMKMDLSKVKTVTLHDTPRVEVRETTPQMKIDLSKVQKDISQRTVKIRETPPMKILPFSQFRYPLNVDLPKLVNDVIENGITNVKPINVYPFSFLEPMEDICDFSTQKIFLLFMIKSAPGNFARRKSIRETWVNNVYFKADVIRHAFLLARTLNETIKERITQEKQQHRDIIEMSFVDNYYNNTLKTIGGINWCVSHCSASEFVMLVDDDIFVATDNLLSYLHGLPKDIIRSLFAGRMWNDVPQRGLQQKWYMSVADYPYNKYPPFLSAGATIMSMEFVKRLQVGIKFTKKFKFDDVFLAIVVHKLGVKPIHHPEIHIHHPVSYTDTKFKTVLASHGYGDPKEMRAAWISHLRILNITSTTNK